MWCSELAVQPQNHRTPVCLSFLICTKETPDLQAVVLHELVYAPVMGPAGIWQ